MELLDSEMRVAIVAENASTEFGGEAFIPFQLFRHLRDRGVQVRLLVHERCRSSLERDLEPEALESVFFARDTQWQKILAFVGGNLPRKLWTFVVAPFIDASTTRQLKGHLRQLIRQGEVDIIHQPIPVSPRMTSSWYGLGVPVVMGPMNGNLDYPPSFRSRQPRMERMLMKYGKWVSELLNRMIPGKLKAECLLVANGRTAAALPSGIDRQKVKIIPENGVTSDFIRRSVIPESAAEKNTTRFAYVGGLLPYKALDLAIEAFSKIVNEIDGELLLIGSGPEEGKLRNLVGQYQLEEKVIFKGHLSHREVAENLINSHVFVFPSIDDCGGAAVLEAMAVSLPIVASKWGGPIDYVDASCGILVEPNNHTDFVERFSQAMLKLGKDRQLCKTMGERGREKIETEFTWEKKVEKFCEIYRTLMTHTP